MSWTAVFSIETKNFNVCVTALNLLTILFIYIIVKKKSVNAVLTSM